MSESVEITVAKSDLDRALEIARPLLASNTDHEEIGIAIVREGFKMARATSLLRQVLEVEGVVLSTVDRNKAVEEMLSNWDFKSNIAEWSDVEQFAVSISEELEDTPKTKAHAAIRKFAKANKIELPGKPKGEGGTRTNKFDEFYAFALKNPTCSEVEISSFIGEFGSTEGQNKKYVWLFNGILGFARKFAGE
jgi:hypothetical protein